MNDPFQDTGTIRELRRVGESRGRSPLGMVPLGIGVAVLVYGLSGLAPAHRDAPVAAVEARADSFAATGIGVSIRAATLTAEPAGAALAPVASGTALRIGGRARVPVGLGVREAYWVSPVSQSLVYGWLWDTEVLVTAGEAPLLTREPRGMVVEAVRVVQAVPAPTVAPAVPVVPAQAATDAPMYAQGGRVAIPWMPESVRRWEELFVAAGARHGVDPELLAILTLVESGGNPRAVSPAGASGLIQVMPATGQGIARERGIVGHTSAALFDPETAVDFGAYYIAQQLARFGQQNDPDWQRSVELAAGAYNAGPGAQQRAGGVLANLPAEGQRYTRWVGGMWQERHQATSPTFEQWMAAGGRVLVQRAGG